MTEQLPCVLHVPETVSLEAQAFLRKLEHPAVYSPFPEADDLAGWKEYQTDAEERGKFLSEQSVKHYEGTIAEWNLGGFRSFDIHPKNWKDNGKVIVYIRGWWHVMFTAAASVGQAAIPANELGLRLISLDYTLAPHAKYNQMSDEVVAQIQALLKGGQRLEDTAVFGCGSGGGLAAAAVLKMRDTGLGMPAAVVLGSPWLDVTPSGDTETTLRNADPNFFPEIHSKFAAAFANAKDQKNPYASPAYADFSKGFPPTLIQGGLKETLLSGFVRFYQGLDIAGVPVKLDLYEGMVHNFQTRIHDAPESIVAWQKIRAFLGLHLGI